MEIPFRIVDVFTERALAGNQLCVVTDAPDLPAETMQALAREIGFSETVFVLEAGADRYRIRIFTPTTEMPFAGHPTLGAAFVLASEGRIGPHSVQEVPAGEFPVEVDLGSGFVWMTQHEPEFGSEIEDRSRVANAVGLEPADLHPDLPPRPVSTGLFHVVVPAASPEAVRRASPDLRALANLVAEAGADGLYLFAEEESGVARARMFAPGVGVVEDPATGSAAGPLGAYLASRGALGMPGRLLIRQGEEIGRPSELHVLTERTGDGWTVRVGGGVRPAGRGVFEVP